jgi:hypothetical protein
MPTQLINLNDTTPSNPSGTLPVKWQADPPPADPAQPRNVSAYVSGVVGAAWYNGTGAPSVSLGTNGDYYLDDSTGNVYQKSAGAWSIAASIKGPQGIQGIQGIQGPIGPAGTTAVFVDGEAPSGAIDGANKVFTLANTPNPAASLRLYKDSGSGGVLQLSPTDYSLSGNTITFVTAPALGSTLLADYRIGSSVQGGCGVTIDGGSAIPTTGSKGFVKVPYNATITGWVLISDVAGSAQITVKKCAPAAFPTTSSIVASAPPSLVSQQMNSDTTLSGWTTTINANDILEFNLDSVTTCKRLTLELMLTRT